MKEKVEERKESKKRNKGKKRVQWWQEHILFLQYRIKNVKTEGGDRNEDINHGKIRVIGRGMRKRECKGRVGEVEHIM